MTALIHELTCFGLAPGQGNRALVVTGDQSTSDERLHFARVQAWPACVFIDHDAEGGAVLDFYYPHKRSPLCGHAALAAAYHLVADGAPPVTVRTALQGQRIRLVREGEIAYLELRRQEVPALAIGTDDVRALLRAAALEPVTPPAVASVGSPKLLVQVRDVAALRALAPDLAAIDAWSRASGVNGIYAWCLRPEPDAATGADAGGGAALTVEGRNFNHLDATREDSATGVGAGALTALLGRGVRLHQGAVVGNPCLIRTQAEGDTVRVGGLVSTLS